MNKFAQRSAVICGLLFAACYPLAPGIAAADSSSAGIESSRQSQLCGPLKIAASEKTGEMSREQMIQHIREANEVAKECMKFGKHPFGAVLVGPDNERIIMRQGNLTVVRHAETELSRRASEAYSSEYLSKCTLVTTMEPCVMCSGNIYFAGIANVVYGASEESLAKLTGSSRMNPTMNLPCRKVFGAGQKAIKVDGPFPELEEELVEPHKGFWK